MLKEEGLNSGQDATRASFFLKDTVFNFVVKIEALMPRVMEMS
jgi:hypothetical protein